MLRSPFKSVIARMAIFALVLSLGIAFVSVGFNPGAHAQTPDDDPCTMDGNAVSCTYDENGTDPVADFSAMDPEGEGIDWAVEGADAADFDITGGVLAFKKAPNYEMPSDRLHDLNDDDDGDDEGESPEGNNVYLVTVRATELLAADQDPPALSSVLLVTVTVGDVEEAGKITLNRLQPQADEVLTATLSDPDRGEDNDEDASGLSWTWSIPKVSRPDIDNDNHWTAAGGSASNTAQESAFTPNASAVSNILRVKVEYTDQEGSDKEVNKLSYYAVRAAPAENAPPEFDSTADFTSNVPEDTAVGTAVGNPIAATDPDDGDILSYELSGTGTDADFFDIDIATGQITVAGELDHENGSEDNDGVYELVVAAYDSSNDRGATSDSRGATDTGHVTITATDVNENPSVTTDDDPAETLEVDEEHLVVLPDPNPDSLTRVVIGAYGAEDEDIGDDTDGEGEPDAGKVKLSLGGDDADAFVLEDADAGNDGNRRLRFKNSPNFEMPDDANQDNVYKVSVIATDDKGLTGMKDLTVEVMNIDEVGTVSLSTIQPGVGQPITATLNDLDGGENDLKWQWARALNAGGPFTDIDGATSATYTPKAPIEDDPATIGINEEHPGDEGYYLRAKVTYRDAQSIDDNETTTTYEEGRRGVDDPTTTTPETTAVGEAPVEKVSQNAVRAVPDVNNAPEFDSATMTREVNENETVNVSDPVTASDPDEDALSYTITGGADMDAFEIGLGSGQIMVGDGTELDAEGKSSYQVEVTAADPFGGSDSTMVTITVLNVNEAPDFEAEDPDDYEENGTGAVATFVATDPEGADIDWSVEGLDSDDFAIEGGVLTFKKAPNYEMPSDRNRDAVTEDLNADPQVIGVEAEAPNNNVYLVTVRASEVRASGAEGATMSTIQDIAVTVSNVDERGTIGLTHVQPQTGVEITASLTDPDGDDEDSANPVDADDIDWLWSVPKVSRPVTDNDDHWTPATATNNTVNYTPEDGDETKVLRVKASYTDGEGAMKTTYKLSYYAVRPQPTANNAPTFPPLADYTRGIAEDAAVDAPVGAPIIASDVNSGDAGKLTYSLTAADDSAGKFKIDKMTGQIRVAMPLNHETASLTDGQYTVTVSVIDPSNNDVTGPEFDTGTAIEQVVTITAADVNEKPTVVLATGTTELMMVDENHAVVDVEADSVDKVEIGTYDATDEDVNDGSIVSGTLTANASQVTLSLGGDDADDFVLGPPDDTTGARELTFKNPPDFESPTDANMDNAYKVTIIATDKKGLQGTRDVTVSVRNLDEVGSVSLSTIQPGVGQPITATLTDGDGGVNGARWQWHSSSTQGGPFAPIHQATSATYTPKETIPDDPATDINEAVTGDEGLYLRVTVTYRDAQSVDDMDTTEYEEGRRGIDNPDTTGDAEGVGEAVVMATSDNAVRAVPEVNNPPEFASGITREVEENSNPGDNVGDEVTATDPDGDPLDYSITGGADMGAFDIDEESGQIEVGDGTELDYEGSQTTYVVEVTAMDPFGGSDSTMVTINVTNVNEPPDLTLLPGGTTPPDDDTVGGRATVSVGEGNTAVGTYTTTITNPTWSLSGPDAGDFSISGGVLSFSSTPDFEAPADANNDNVYMVTVVAANGGATSATLAVTVTVTDDPSDNQTGGGFNPNSYDANNDGSIDKEEVLNAIDDYFEGDITKEQVLDVIDLYFN